MPLHSAHAETPRVFPAARTERWWEDRRIAVQGVPWARYVALEEALGDRPVPRVCYCEGTLELMSPGWLHEYKKKTVSRLLELYALLRDVPLQGRGSMTYCKKSTARGAEPDECYFLGKPPPTAGNTTKRPPDLVIEVVVSQSAIDRLSLYAGLGVPELWLWRDDRLAVFHLGKTRYREATRSRLMPELDIEELASFAKRDDQAAAVKAYGKHLSRPARRRR
jgi:Uma2 family endonuclease